MNRAISKKAAIILLALLMFMQMFPAQSFAAEALQGGSTPVNYINDNGGKSSCNKYDVLSSEDAAITTLIESEENDGWYVVSGDVTISNSANNCLTCNGNIKLILLDDSSLTVKSTGGNAINVERGKSLTITAGSKTSVINGSGRLTCKGGDNTALQAVGSAGIGAGSLYNYTEVGDIKINGGVVEAEGADSSNPGPGIGSSASSEQLWAEVAGSLTVNGGNVKLTGGQQTGSFGYGASGVNFGFYRTGSGFYVNGGDLYVAGTSDSPAVFARSGCKYSIIGEKVGIVGTNTSWPEEYTIDHTSASISSTLANSDTLHFIDGIRYTDADGTTHTLPGKELTSESTTMDAADSYDGLFFVRKDTVINNSLVVKGDAVLVIADGALLTVNGDASKRAGIRVDSGNSLTIETGTLVANGNANNGGAGIGAYASQTCGDITINKGNVTANGTGSAPGIGGSRGTNGKITIGGNSTTVNATGGSNGTGIGGGKNAGGEIVINGGTVTANGNGNGAGIGGSADVNVTINGGTINASGDGSVASSGAGIGGSHNCGNGVITINAGYITATGGKCSAGIGTGAGSAATTNLSGGTISINEGEVTAEGGANDSFGGAGIGGGYKGDATEIVINGGRITATGGSASSRSAGGAGIGTGSGGKNYSIKINGGIINATGEKASAIGKGKDRISADPTGTVLVDGNELVWASNDYETRTNVESRIVNDGEDLSGTDDGKLGGKAYAYANNTLKSAGIELGEVTFNTISAEDYAKIVNNLDKIAFTINDRAGRQNFQLELLDRMYKERYPDDEARAEYINSILVNENNIVTMGVVLNVRVVSANLNAGEDSFIEYNLDPYAVAKGNLDGLCKLTTEDFENQGYIIDVTMPICGNFVPGTVSHTSNDGKTTYETFTQDGSKKFSYNTEAKTVGITIHNCSNLRISAKKAVNTGDFSDMTMLPIVIAVMMLALIGASIVLRRKSGIR